MKPSQNFAMLTFPLLVWAMLLGETKCEWHIELPPPPANDQPPVVDYPTQWSFEEF